MTAFNIFCGKEARKNSAVMLDASRSDKKNRRDAPSFGGMLTWDENEIKSGRMPFKTEKLTLCRVP